MTMRKLIAAVAGLALVVAASRSSVAPDGDRAGQRTIRPSEVQRRSGGGELRSTRIESADKAIIEDRRRRQQGPSQCVVSVPRPKTPTAKKITVDQHGCKFVPHVSATTPGEVELKNSDDILHNIHTYSTANPSINKAQPKFKKVMAEKFEKPEIIKLTCDVHSWMLGWVAVMPNPFFGVTDANGVAKVENVPPGKYKVEVWHETLGKQTKDVEVKAGQTTKVASR
jgi:hypothetical protein